MMRVIGVVALVIVCIFRGAAVGFAAPALDSAVVTGVAVSQANGNAIVDVQIQGNAQYGWHRLREPDNRFWVDITNARLNAPLPDANEPAPLGAIRVRQMNPTTVRVAIALTAPKVLEVLSSNGGLRIVVHPQDAGTDIVRSGTGTLSATVANAVIPTNSVKITPHKSLPSNTAVWSNDISGVTTDASEATQALGPTAAQIREIENGKSPATIPIPNVTPQPQIAPNAVMQIAEIPNATPTPTPLATPDVQNSTANQTGPTAAQISQMTGEATPGPNPLLSTAPSNWKFAPRGNYTATNPRLIIIDPGHGGSDRGASRNGVDEATLTLDMAKRLRDILIERGWEVMMTRTTDVDVYKPNDSAHDELQARVDVGNNAGARLFVSIHGNSFYNSTPNGTTTYYTKAIDVPLAADVQNELARTLGTKDDGIIKNNLYVTNHSNMPSILVETAFLSNPTDFAKLTDGNWRQKVAQGIADGIATYAGAPPK